MFQDIFVEPLGTTLDRTPGSFAIMIPSVRDILSDHAVLPQNELSSDYVSDPVSSSFHITSLMILISYYLHSKRIKLFPNPSTFALDGRHFAITSVDTLFHIKKEELLKRVEPDAELDSTDFANDAPGTDAFGAVVRHVIRQRRYELLC
jgi:DNA polymerase alpha subunit B